MKRTILPLLFLLASIHALGAMAEQNPLDSVFTSARVTGTLLITSLDGKKEFVHNADRAHQRFFSASTFKIFNTLIALEYGAIRGPDDIIVWDGRRYEDFPDWNQNHTLASAYKVSCVWCFQQLARKIGADVYRERIKEAHYGQLSTPFTGDRFWLDGSLTLSAREQIDFLRRVILQQLPYKQQSYDDLRKVMQMEQTPAYKLYAKTGWAARASPPIGWYVGYVDTRKGTWLFALNMDIKDASALPMRQTIAMEGLRRVGVIEPSPPQRMVP